MGIGMGMGMQATSSRGSSSGSGVSCSSMSSVSGCSGVLKLHTGNVYVVGEGTDFVRDVTPHLHHHHSEGCSLLLCNTLP